ncbi:AAA family ATPase [Paenibacillus macquariensis]|uniref:Predicted ATP-dependent endonuclease of the OLD family, contains P-loop ATPase and TOPRIM domains n=1 Tax=Paenibacillus macquariensis TaxID=948756 RepID=A0ABY1KDV5_9BACL|nr:AAA family ATPase [Paenibacillus macquariensis]MEC0093818.1 AAA family ATPase [Paenibacillus macquariensis]OAB33601.1 ATP-dependent endonuclease [Paenibacillus macquariensis subsp. macquariensis]SIR67545.1 Predicted ATP-dependent endonuclease of the OLD family, contains P-loop ATPase and TOPRIM domains [Paenibacillus macquariensis]
MYISGIKLENYRNFKNKAVSFNDGINVIIGHNNAGKTNLIKALALVLDSNGKKRLDIHDFNKSISLDELRCAPPKIRISVTIKQSDNEDLNSDDLVTVANWLTKLDEPYEAVLTYEFHLPEKETEKYIATISQSTDKDKAWRIIQQEFLRLYIFKIWGGNVVNQTTADSESLQKFDFQFLDAIRDVERDMLSGRNTLLRDVLDFFMDYDIKSDSKRTEIEKLEEIKLKKQSFSDTADMLLSHLSKRMLLGKEQILSYAKDTGASFNKAKPNFEGSISDVELFSALKLIVEYETGIKIPATHNGLGYNNLIFMSLLLSKMQVNSDGSYLGSNAKVFPVLAIEEPEAHLHPAMQYQFLKFLLKNKEDKKVRQIFVTTHSTHITSSVSLDEMICLHNEIGETSVGYPAKVFKDNEKSKKYVQRFLDATKSDMLFAQNVILVEGIAEQLLLPILARYLGISLEEKHIAVVNVGGRYFEHFLYLFNTNNPYAIHKKIACITDRDPERKKKAKGASYGKCYPYEYGIEGAKYEYKENPSFTLYPRGGHSNIAIFSQDETEGKTFEYDLILHNPSLDLLLTNSMKNQDEIKKLMEVYKRGGELLEYERILRKSEENDRVIESMHLNTSWESNQKSKAFIATRYLNSVGKGENALELASALTDNLYKIDTTDFQNFTVPNYIKEAITWIVQ